MSASNHIYVLFSRSLDFSIDRHDALVSCRILFNMKSFHEINNNVQGSNHAFISNYHFPTTSEEGGRN